MWISPPPQPVHITLCQEAPSFWVGCGCFSAWGGEVVGEASLHHYPEPCLQHEVVPMQGAVRSPGPH